MMTSRFAFLLLVLSLGGCSRAASVFVNTGRSNPVTVEGRILGSDPWCITVEHPSGTPMRIPRGAIEGIDHPGSGAVAVGAILIPPGALAVVPGSILVDLGQPGGTELGVGLLAGGLSTVVLGIGMVAWGLSTESDSRDAAAPPEAAWTPPRPGPAVSRPASSLGPRVAADGPR